MIRRSTPTKHQKINKDSHYLKSQNLRALSSDLPLIFLVECLLKAVIVEGRPPSRPREGSLAGDPDNSDEGLPPPHPFLGLLRVLEIFTPPLGVQLWLLEVILVISLLNVVVGLLEDADPL